MIFIQLNDMNSYCHDGVYAFFDPARQGIDQPDRKALQQVLRRADFFGGRSYQVQEACERFRAALEAALEGIPGLRLAWTTQAAEPLAFEQLSQLSDCEVWQVAERRLSEWQLSCYGSTEFPARDGNNDIWLVHSWLANLGNIGNPQRASFIQLLAAHVVEVTLTQANDPTLGPCWDAHFEAFHRGNPHDGGVERFLLTAAGDLPDLTHTLVLDHLVLEEHLLRFVQTHA